LFCHQGHLLVVVAMEVAMGDFTEADFTEEDFAAAVSDFTGRTGIPSVMAVTMMTKRAAT
jgi:hypothetical protein